MLTKLAVHSSKNEMSLISFSSVIQNQVLRYSKRMIQYLISICLEVITWLSRLYPAYVTGHLFFKNCLEEKFISEMLKSAHPLVLYKYICSSFFLCSLGVGGEWIRNTNSGTVFKKKTSSGNINQPQMARVNFLHESFLPRSGIGSLCLHNNRPYKQHMNARWLELFH